MKVTTITTLSAARFNYVKIETDEGLTGVGELHPASGTGGTPFVPRAAVEYCAEYLLGKDPLQIERHWQHMFRRQLFRGGSDMMAAMGAIDIALWDIKGKEAGKPVYELLGGPTREKVRLYTHLGGNTPEALAEEAQVRVEEGFTALRVYPFGDFGNSDFEEGLGLETMSYTGMQRNAVERISAVREAAGPDIDIMIDVVNRLTPAEAIGLGRALDSFNLYFYEDPIEPENMEQWGWVAEQQPIPLAMGERLYTVYQFQDLLDHKGAAFVRPDLSLAGGITNVKKIAAIAEANYVGVVPHNPLSCVLTAACVQLDAAVHNIAVQEYPHDDDSGVKAELVKEPLKRVGGYLEVPTTPGIGVELNEESFKHHPPVPYARPALINYDGSLRDY
ncbi:MAG: galactonate dehydratase [Chloroflexi bacterium]|mgnify:FL=1|nr:galactonate dehydratase [Chloroflexota bacterium]|tara:strand:- start:179 stop:1348 length:1170 start_codon:yes stop_codon:yes gene_type:complete